MKASKVILNILSVICFIYGALYLFTLVFIPVAIYCFLAGRRFSYKADNPDDTNNVSNNSFKGYVIFVSIFCLPFGLLSIIPYIYLTGHNVKITEVKDENEGQGENNTVTWIQGQSGAEENKGEALKVEADVPVTESEKQAKYEKLKNFHEKGIINDEEFEMAEQELFGKDKKSD